MMLHQNHGGPWGRQPVRRIRCRLAYEILAFALAFALLGINATAATPVAWWKFDDAQNPGLDSVAGNNAVLIGDPLPAVTLGRSGGGAIDLNGKGQYLAVPGAPALDITDRLTILVWAKAKEVAANYPFVCKASAWDDGQMSYALDLQFPQGLYPHFWISSDGHATGYSDVVSPVALHPDQWYLIAGVYDGRSLNLYVDGQLQASTPYDEGIYAGTDPLYLGWDWNPSTWNGALDDVRIFDVALSADEIRAIYESERPTLKVALARPFGRVPVGQTQTNEVVFTNSGTNDLTVAAALTGPAADRFQHLDPAGSFILHPGASNALAVPISFQPDAAGAFVASLSVTGGSSVVQVPLAGQGVTNAWRSLSLDLQTRDSPASQPEHMTRTISSSQMAILVIDMWDSHPDPGEASRTAALIPMMNQALDSARAQGIPVIFCPNEVPLPAGADRSVFESLPGIQQVDNGFSPPLPPYTGAVAGDMVPIPYHAAHAPAFANPARQHPQLIIKPGDLASVSRQEILNYCAANDINYLLYMGVAANMCISFTREVSMIPMQRYGNLQPIMVRDLTTSMSLNGRIKGGNDDSASNFYPTMTPSRGDRDVTASIETYICPTINARQLMQNWDPAKYANLMTGQSNLMSYLRMDSQARYQEILDLEREQSVWWNRDDSNQMAGLSFGIPGAIDNDPDTAVKFNGASTLVVSPIYRLHIPATDPLTSLSATNFTLELWVQINQLTNSNQWFYAHDDGTSSGVDVLLGLNASNHFEFVVGRNASGDGFGDVIESTNLVTQTDVDTHRWFYLVAEHDLSHNKVALYVDGAGPIIARENCTPVSLDGAPHLGSRGLLQFGADGYLSSLGVEGFNGALDEIAIYSSALDASTIGAHYHAAVPEWPVIADQPQDLVVTNGDSATFTVGARGIGLLSYQWYDGQSNLLAGASGPQLRLKSVTVDQAGSYWVVVSNQAGVVWSREAQLSVLTLPEIAAGPTNQVATNGDTVTLTVQAGGTQPLGYQWYFSGSDAPADATDAAWLVSDANALAGATNAQLVLSNVTAQAAGTYVVTVSNPAGRTLSEPVSLIVFEPPLIVFQPQNLNIREGDPARFTVSVTGTPPINFEWLMNGTNVVAGATASELVLTNVAAAQGGSYSVIVSNLIGSTTSEPAVLRVLVPPEIADQPQDQVVTNGQPADFTASASGTQPLSYQWYYGESNLLAGASGPQFHLEAVTGDQAGPYRVMVSNQVGVVWSREAQLTVLSAPEIAVNPTNQVATNGDTVTLTVQAGGTQPLGYQWYFSGSDAPADATDGAWLVSDTNAVAGATNAQLVLSNVTVQAAGTYMAVVSNLLGRALSATANLTVLESPLIVAQPENLTIRVGGIARFTVSVTGTPPFNFEWLLNGTNVIAGATAGELLLTNVTAEQAGSYSVLVSNITGSTISETALLRVLVPPGIASFGYSEGIMSIAFTTSPGLRYTVEYKSNLADASWTALPGASGLAGTGGAITVQDSNRYQRSRYYRVLVE